MSLQMEQDRKPEHKSTYGHCQFTFDEDATKYTVRKGPPTLEIPLAN